MNTFMYKLKLAKTDFLLRRFTGSDSWNFPDIKSSNAPYRSNTAKVPFQLMKFSKNPPSTGAIIGATPFTALTIARNLVRTGPR